MDEMRDDDKVELANCIFGQGRAFVPVIYMDQKKVGGYGELLDMSKKGDIHKVL